MTRPTRGLVLLSTTVLGVTVLLVHAFAALQRAETVAGLAAHTAVAIAGAVVGTRLLRVGERLLSPR